MKPGMLCPACGNVVNECAACGGLFVCGCGWLFAGTRCVCSGKKNSGHDLLAAARRTLQFLKDNGLSCGRDLERAIDAVHAGFGNGSYRAYVKRSGCVPCGGFHIWSVYAPDGSEVDTHFTTQESAARLAEMLTQAYKDGFLRALTLDDSVPPSDADPCE